MATMMGSRSRSWSSKSTSRRRSDAAEAPTECASRPLDADYVTGRRGAAIVVGNGRRPRARARRSCPFVVPILSGTPTARLGRADSLRAMAAFHAGAPRLHGRDRPSYSIWPAMERTVCSRKGRASSPACRNAYGLPCRESSKMLPNEQAPSAARLLAWQFPATARR
jgi:hypothetical protein